MKTVKESKLRSTIHRYRYVNIGRLYLLIITAILILSHKCYYLWLQDDYMLGRLKYSDISVVLSVLFAIIIRIRYGSVKAKIKYAIYFFWGLSIVSAFTANFIYDQSLIRGFIVQRCQFAYLTLFLPVEKLLEMNRISKKNLERLLYILAWFELFLCTLQYVIYVKYGVLFLRIGIGVRYNAERLYFDPAILLMVVFKSYQEFLTQSKNRIRNFIFIFWVALYFMIITKMRAMTLCYLCCLLIGLFVWREELITKMFVISFTFLTGAKFLTRFTIIKDIFNILLNLESDANLNVRKMGRTVFFNEFIKSPITGRGYPSISSKKAYGALKGYLFVDNGIFGLIYSYGILGLFWCLGLFIYLTRISWTVRKSHFYYLLYILYYILGLMTDFSWFWSATSSFSIMIALLLAEKRYLKANWCERKR